MVVVKIKSKKHIHMCQIKLKFEDYKNCLRAAATAQFENKINHLGKNKNDVKSLKEYY